MKTPVILKVGRETTFMPKTRMNNGAWTQTRVKHKEIDNKCCSILQKAIENEWFEYNPKTLKLGLYEYDTDEYGDLRWEEYFDISYCPFCGAEIEIKLISDIEKHYEEKWDIKEVPQTLVIKKNRRMECTEKDVMK